MSQAFERPFRPLELAASPMTSLPIHAMAQQLMTEDAFNQSGRSALTLARDRALTVILTVMKAGATLNEHQAPGPVTLVPLFGQITLASAQGDSLPLDHASAAVFAAQTPHRVEAQTDSAFLIVMGGKG